MKQDQEIKRIAGGIAIVITGLIVFILGIYLKINDLIPLITTYGIMTAGVLSALIGLLELLPREPEKYRFLNIPQYKLISGSVILLIGIIISVSIGFMFPGSPLKGIGTMGIGIMITTLIGSNYLSPEHSLRNAEVRKSIAISSMAVLFGLLAVGDSIQNESEFFKTIAENFWKVVVAVNSFYFIGRSAEEIAGRVINRRTRKGSSENQEENAYSLSINDISDWKILLGKLKAHDQVDSDPVSRRVWELLSDECKNIIEKWDTQADLDENQKSLVVKDLNKIIKMKDFYDPEVFKQVKIKDEISKILAESLLNLPENLIMKINYEIIKRWHF